MQVTVKRSGSDWSPALKRLRYDLVLEISARGRVAAFLALQKRPVRCPEHTRQHVETNCAEDRRKCPMEHFFVPPGREACSECARLTAEKPEHRLEITGHGLELGLGAAIVEYFFTPWTDPESTRVNEIHVALDFDLPSGPIIVFPKSRRLSKLTAFLTSDRSSSARVPRPYEYFFNHTVGSPEREVCIYDKISHVWDDDERTPHERPRGTKSFADCLRIEFRTKPKKAREVDGLIRRMRPFIEKWRVADLRHAPKLELSPAMDRVLRLTRDHGFLPKQASKKDAFEESSGGFANYIIRRLSGFGMKLGAAEQLAREVQSEVMDALDRLAEVSHIDLARCFDEAADQLQEELELIVGVGATADPRAA